MLLKQYNILYYILKVLIHNDVQYTNIFYKILIYTNIYIYIIIIYHNLNYYYVYDFNMIYQLEKKAYLEVN